MGFFDMVVILILFALVMSSISKHLDIRKNAKELEEEQKFMKLLGILEK